MKTLLKHLLLLTAICSACSTGFAASSETEAAQDSATLVAADIAGNLITEVVQRGRIDKGMPAFATLGSDDLRALAAYVHAQKILADAAEGGRRSVAPEDLAGGSATDGQRYFAANCSACHNAIGDMAGIASRFEGLALLRRMLYPAPASAATLIVVTETGTSFSGPQAYRDEFTVALIDTDGTYRSWPTSRVHVVVNDPLAAHVEQLAYLPR